MSGGVVTVVTSLDELRAGPPTIGLPELAHALGISLTSCKELRQRGELPVPTLQLGRRVRIPTAAVVALLDPGRTEGDAVEDGIGEHNALR